MAQDLAERFAEARETLAEADEALGFKLSELMADGPMETLTLTANTQPAIVAHSVAVVRALRALVAPEPLAVAGHSLGEYSALVAAGALSLTDALRAVRAWDFMQEAVPEGLGAMAAVIGLDASSVREVCERLSAEGALVCAAKRSTTRRRPSSQGITPPSTQPCPPSKRRALAGCFRCLYRRHFTAR